MGIASDVNCHNFNVIIDNAKNMSNEILLMMEISFSLNLKEVVLSAQFLTINAAVIPPTDAGNAKPVLVSKSEIMHPNPTVRSS